MRMPVRANIQPALLKWARHRARLSTTALASRFPKLEEWEAGRAAPTLRQLEAFAQATHTPVGYLFLSEAPAETVPIPDFRTHAAAGVHEPSANLLDTLYVCQQRQEWYREFARATGEIPLPFVGSLQVGSDVIIAAAAIRDALKFDVGEPSSSNLGRGIASLYRTRGGRRDSRHVQRHRVEQYPPAARRR